MRHQDDGAECRGDGVRHEEGAARQDHHRAGHFYTNRKEPYQVNSAKGASAGLWNVDPYLFSSG